MKERLKNLIQVVETLLGKLNMLCQAVVEPTQHSGQSLLEIMKIMNINMSVLAGSVITKNIVITAAHCTFDNEDDLFIHAGALNLKRLGSTKRKIIQTIEHPDYKPPKVYFDVALAVLEKFLSFDETIFPVCLPTQSYPIQSLSKDGARITMETLEKT